MSSFWEPLYGDLVQLTSPTSIEVTEAGDGNVSYGTPTVITADNIAAIDLTKISYLQMEGVYSSSQNSDGTETYHNITISGASAQGSISYPHEKYGDVTLAELSGHNIVVTGFFCGGNHDKYRNILIVSVEDKGELEITEKTIDEVKKTADNTVVKTSGTVMAICTRGYILSDNSGAIYISIGNTWTCDVTTGDKVTITGTKGTLSNGCIQISDPDYSVTESSSATPEYPNPTVLNATALDAYTGSTGDYIQVKGSLSGNRITVDGASRSVSLSNPPASLNHGALDGMNVTLTGYFTNLYSTETYSTMYVIAVSLEAAESYLKADIAGIEASATSATISISSNTDWTVEKTSGDWATLGTTTSGTGDGTVEITCEANTDANERTATFTIKGTGVESPVIVTLIQMGTAVKSYVKVTSAPSDWSGTYLIVFEEAKRAYNGALTSSFNGSATVNNYYDVTITENAILASPDVNSRSVTIESQTDGYSIKTASGYYIGKPDNKNGLEGKDTYDSGYLNTLTFADSRLTIKSAGGRIMLYNKSANYIRYYSSSNEGKSDYYSPVLYKLED